MKTSLDCLPEEKRRNLEEIASYIVEAMPETEAVILFGSYARNTYVEFDRRYDYGVPTTFSSDYDILVLTRNIKQEMAQHRVDQAAHRFYRQHPASGVVVQSLVLTINKFNEFVLQRRYFYTDIISEGILLYQSATARLATPGVLNYKQTRRQMQWYFKERYHQSKVFLDIADYLYSKSEYKISSLNLHQAAENLYHTVGLVFTLDKPRQHDLTALASETKKFSPELWCVFPRDTEEEKRLFELLRDAYIRSRYDPAFVVTKEDIEALISKVKLLAEVVAKICEEHIRSFDALIE